MGDTIVIILYIVFGYVALYIGVNCLYGEIRKLKEEIREFKKQLEDNNENSKHS